MKKKHKKIWEQIKEKYELKELSPYTLALIFEGYLKEKLDEN